MTAIVEPGPISGSPAGLSGLVTLIGTLSCWLGVYLLLDLPRLSELSTALVLIVPGTGFLGWPGSLRTQAVMGLLLGIGLLSSAWLLLWRPLAGLRLAVTLLGAEALGLIGVLWFVNVPPRRSAWDWGGALLFFGLSGPFGTVLRTMVLAYLAILMRSIRSGDRVEPAARARGLIVTGAVLVIETVVLVVVGLLAVQNTPAFFAPP